MMAKPRNYFPVLDGMRGVAALLVVARHAEAFLGGNPFPESYLAVDLFFLLSGVVLFRSYEGRLRRDLTPGAFVVMRLLRLYPLYALGSIIGLFTVLVASTPPLRTVVLAAAMVPDFNLHHRELFPFDGPAWTLCLEVAGSIAYGLVGFRMATWRLAAFAGCMLIVLGLLLLAMPEHSLDLGWSNHTFVGGIARLAFSFTSGVVVGRIVVGRLTPPVLDGWRGTLATVAILTVAGAILMASPQVRWLYDLAAVAVAFPLIVWVSLMLRPSRVTAALCHWLGVVSFPVYAIHQPAARLLSEVLVRHGMAVSAFAPAGGILLLVGLAGAATAIDRFYDRPVRRWLGTWLLQDRTAVRAALPQVATHAAVAE